MAMISACCAGLFAILALSDGLARFMRYIRVKAESSRELETKIKTKNKFKIGGYYVTSNEI